jgi:hypothetical protein
MNFTFVSMETTNKQQKNTALLERIIDIASVHVLKCASSGVLDGIAQPV